MKIYKALIKYLVFAALYIDRFIVAIFPMLSSNRIDLAYMDQKNKKNSITRVSMMILIASMIYWPYWAAFVGGFCAIYVIYWVVKNRIEKTKVQRNNNEKI